MSRELHWGLRFSPWDITQAMQPILEVYLTGCLEAGDILDPMQRLDTGEYIPPLHLNYGAVAARMAEHVACDHRDALLAIGAGWIGRLEGYWRGVPLPLILHHMDCWEDERKRQRLLFLFLMSAVGHGIGPEDDHQLEFNTTMHKLLAPKMPRPLWPTIDEAMDFQPLEEYVAYHPAIEAGGPSAGGSKL